MQEAKVIHRLLPILKIYPSAVAAIITLGFVSSLLEGLGISLFIPLIQSFIQPQSLGIDDNYFINFFNQIFNNYSNNQRLLIVVLCIFCSVVLKNCLVYGKGILFAWFNGQVGHQLRSGVFQQLLSVSYSFIENSDSGDLVNILCNETWQTSEALATSLSLVTTICNIAVYVSILLLISWRLTLLVTVLMVLISFVNQIMTRQVKKLGKRAVEVNSVLAKRMWEGLAGMREIRAFGREDYEQKRLTTASSQVVKTFLKLEIVSGTVGPVSEILSLFVLLCILVSALVYNRGLLPQILTFIFVLHRLQPLVIQLNGIRVGLITLVTAVEDVMSFLDPSDKPYIHSGNTPYKSINKGIYFESVSFQYYPEETPALEDVSICIPSRKTTAIVGPSGAGKSTIIALICRFYEVNSGEIYVDNYSLREVNLTDWRSQIAIVSQDIYMFSATILENIAYGRLDAAKDEIITAAKLANAHEFIQELPQGYHTKVGDRGLRLSGGQRQRIALARAIVRNPQILILDEATNALDSIAENLIQEALNTLSHNRTVIIIAHRLSTIEQADQIIVLNEGKVVEQGNLQHLLKIDGLFAQLYNLQHRKTNH
ncbi:ABC transporter ATP-binding protein [Nostoc sp. UHCC 0302]|uniref:ABC transporter ATP-binding protein n=1 Tax=Nostoc sp. UHCC 0302 TaxID=3134896 RepID=UPI00311CAC15